MDAEVFRKSMESCGSISITLKSSNQHHDADAVELKGLKPLFGSTGKTFQTAYYENAGQLFERLKSYRKLLAIFQIPNRGE